MDIKLAVVKGDGIGPEIVTEAEKILDKIGALYGHTFAYTDILAGGCAIDATGVPCLRNRSRRLWPLTLYCWARWADRNGTACPEACVRKNGSAGPAEQAGAFRQHPPRPALHGAGGCPAP